MKFDRLVVAAACVGLGSCQNNTDPAPSHNSGGTPSDFARAKPHVSERAIYRCEKGEQIEVDWMSADGHPRLRTRDRPTTIELRLAGNDYVGEGFTLNGVETISVIHISWPGERMQACRKL